VSGRQERQQPCWGKREEDRSRNSCWYLQDDGDGWDRETRQEEEMKDEERWNTRPQNQMSSTDGCIDIAIVFLSSHRRAVFIWIGRGVELWDLWNKSGRHEAGGGRKRRIKSKIPRKEMLGSRQVTGLDRRRIDQEQRVGEWASDEMILFLKKVIESLVETAANLKICSEMRI
jgi:hypothetical protein